MRCAALISFMAARTFMSGSMSVTRVWMIMKPKDDILFVSSSFTLCAISSLVCSGIQKMLNCRYLAAGVTAGRQGVSHVHAVVSEGEASVQASP